MACQLEQLVLSLLLAFAAGADHPSRTLIFLCVLGIGVGNAAKDYMHLSADGR